MSRIALVFALVGATAISGLAATARPSQGSMPGMSAASMKGSGSAKMMAMHADMAAMRKMSNGMMAAKGSTADIAFARMMLAHHQGALDMANVELKYGSDMEAKRMARQIIDEQTKGKADLAAWLRTHGG